MELVIENNFTEQHPWIGIFLWSLGIALLIFTLIQLRIGYLDPYLNDNTDAILFGMPHILVASWGVIAGFSLLRLSSNKFSLALIKYPFLTLLFVIVFFDIIILLWRAMVDPISHKDYIESVFIFLFSGSTHTLTLLWIIVPFFVGYIIGYIVKKLCKFFKYS